MTRGEWASSKDVLSSVLKSMLNVLIELSHRCQLDPRFVQCFMFEPLVRKEHDLGHWIKTFSNRLYRIPRKKTSALSFHFLGPVCFLSSGLLCMTGGLEPFGRFCYHPLRPSSHSVYVECPKDKHHLMHPFMSFILITYSISETCHTLRLFVSLITFVSISISFVKVVPSFTRYTRVPYGYCCMEFFKVF